MRARELDVDNEAQVQQLVTLIQTLGVRRVESAVEPLIRILEGPELPRAIQREAISALGRIGDPRAVEVLIAVQFSIPDMPGTQSIGERALRALAAIGEDALPGLLITFVGRNPRVNTLAEQHGINAEMVRWMVLETFGIIGSPRVTEPILASFPSAGCGRDATPADDVDLLTERAFHANALGFIADPAAVSTLCACNGVSQQPQDVYEIAAALGRIGGEQAFECLAKLPCRGPGSRLGRPSTSST
jgi:HEAT repeat protein